MNTVQRLPFSLVQKCYDLYKPPFRTDRNELPEPADEIKKAPIARAGRTSAPVQVLWLFGWSFSDGPFPHR
jgi:hypothetical protein